MKNVIIIGAGLSGIYAATLLQKHFNVTILEARDRIGGRILTVDGFDMGPSWVWSHQHHILQLIRENRLELFAQHTKGDALYDGPGGIEHFAPPPSAPSGRIRGGVIALVNRLADQLKPGTLKLRSAVTAIEDKGDTLSVVTDNLSYEAELVLNTLPPRLAAESIIYRPELGEELTARLASIPTWMGNSAKCTIEFEAPFWREKGLSGFAFSPVGPLGELHDACTPEKFALFGFFHVQAPDKSPEAVRSQMVRLFGNDAEKIKRIYITDWTKERFTSLNADHKTLAAHPDYGYRADAFHGKLIFIGTESSSEEGGYLEGAVVSVKNAVKKCQKEV